MNTIKQWLSLDPLDTLFFRGSDQMVAGENHEITSMFPPMPSTILGAIRTAIMKQRGIDPRTFTQASGADPAVAQRFPLLGTPDCPGFEVCGPLFTVDTPNGEPLWFVPAPAHWFVEPPAPFLQNDSPKTVELRVAHPMSEDALNLGVCGTVSAPLLLHKPSSSSYKSLSGWWTTMPTIRRFSRVDCGEILLASDQVSLTGHESLVVPLAMLTVPEQRMGIALKVSTRRVKEGHLYGAVHFRLRPGIRLAVGLSKDLAPSHLDPTGVLTLGGEQRLVRYEILGQALPLEPTESRWIMALNPVPARIVDGLGWRERPRFSGPILQVAGWDMRTRFHKETTSFLPAGTVVLVDVDEKFPFGFIKI